MPRSIRFHLDENVHGAIAPALRRLGIDVTTTPELLMKAERDEGQLRFAYSDGRVLFTQDRDFLRLHASGAEHSGIAYCEKASRSVSSIVEYLQLMWEVYEPDEMRGRVEHL